MYYREQGLKTNFHRMGGKQAFHTHSYTSVNTFCFFTTHTQRDTHTHNSPWVCPEAPSLCHSAICLAWPGCQHFPTGCFLLWYTSPHCPYKGHLDQWKCSRNWRELITECQLENWNCSPPNPRIFETFISNLSKNCGTQSLFQSNFKVILCSAIPILDISFEKLESSWKAFRGFPTRMEHLCFLCFREKWIWKFGALVSVPC